MENKARRDGRAPPVPTAAADTPPPVTTDPATKESTAKDSATKDSTPKDAASSESGAIDQSTTAKVEDPSASATKPLQRGPRNVPRNAAPPRPDKYAFGRQRADARAGTGAAKMPPPPVNNVVPKAKARNATLQSGRYAITAYVWRTGDQYVESTGSILSQSVDKLLLGAKAPGKYAGDLTLGQMRKLTPGMSSFSRIHRFCTADGTAMTDETISLEDYLALDAVEEVAEKPAVGKSEAEKASKDSDAKKKPNKVKEDEANGGESKGDEAKGKSATEGEVTKEKADQDAEKIEESESVKDAEVKKDVTKPPPKAVVPKLSIYYRTPARVATAGMDLANATGPSLNMGMRPQPGFGSSGDPSLSGAAGTDASGNPVPGGRLVAPTPESLINADRSFGMNTAGNSAGVTAGTLSEDQWAVVLRNCAVFYGWKVNKMTGQISRAPRAAFQLRSKIETEPVAQIPTFVEDKEAVARIVAEARDAEFERSVFDASDIDFDVYAKPGAEIQSGQLQIQALYEQGAESAMMSIRKSVKGIPNFRVNDDSRIDIAACQESLAVSLAKSDFSSQSTEASVAGGAYGVQVGVSGGYASSSENKKVNKDGSSTHTLVAKYMYPRCDIFLRAEDLEPTTEFRALLEKAKIQKSIDAVRAIHDQYGQLFCQELTLGARLLTTKIVTATENTSIDEHKEQMKVSVGVSVQTPYGGASVKHEQESGSASANSKTATSTRETNVFEAVGGDTILANNPAAWAPTAALPNLWRVINRDGLSTMIDMISEMPGFEGVQGWFVQAVPALQKYIRLNAGLSTNVRFKVLSPTNNLSVENLGNSLYYMGFDPATTTTPRLNGLRQSYGTPFWERVDIKETHVLFHPASFRAPCLHGFTDFNVGDAPFGSKYNSKFAETQWNLIAPFGDEFKTGTPYELKHGSRVILRTVPYRKADQPKVDGKDSPPPPSHMVVFRNSQGVLMPAISDRDEYQYWRVEKTTGGPFGEPIKGGDSIRLSWKFADQVTGFRDYTDDVFGRRRNQCPSELESATLYLKVPWPRFEVKNTPTAMIMSAQATTEVTKEMLSVRPGNYPYTLQDLQFRIDTVEQNGLGDSGDYMMAAVTQEADERTVQYSGRIEPPIPKPAPEPLQVWKRIAAFGTLFAGLF